MSLTSMARALSNFAAMMPLTSFAAPERGATRAEAAPEQVAPEEVVAAVAAPGADDAAKQPTQHATMSAQPRARRRGGA